MEIDEQYASVWVLLKSALRYASTESRSVMGVQGIDPHIVDELIDVLDRCGYHATYRPKTQTIGVMRRQD